jgi:hypothetical protein
MQMESRRKHSRLVPASRMVRIQDVISQLRLINYRAIAAWQFQLL